MGKSVDVEDDCAKPSCLASSQPCPALPCPACLKPCSVGKAWPRSTARVVRVSARCRGCDEDPADVKRERQFLEPQKFDGQTSQTIKYNIGRKETRHSTSPSQALPERRGRYASPASPPSSALFPARRNLVVVQPRYAALVNKAATPQPVLVARLAQSCFSFSPTLNNHLGNPLSTQCFAANETLTLDTCQ